MSKIGDGRPGVSAPKQQPATDKAATKSVSAQQLANLFGSLTTASASPAKPVTATSAKQAMVATPAMTAALAQPQAVGREVLPNLLGPLTNEKMTECFNKAFNEVYQGTKLPSGQERTELLAFATKLREKQPDITAADLREALVGELRKRRDGGDVVTPAKIQKYVEEAVSWTATCYEGGPRGPTSSEMAEWTAFAKQQMADNPEMTPDQLSAAIMDAVRNKATGMSAGANGKVNVDKFIQDAVSWSSNVYQGGSRSATSAELTKWRAFADKTMEENPDMTPSQLASAIMDAVRDDMTGVSGPVSKANVDKFINDAVSWAAKVYQGADRNATPAELSKWRAFADKKIEENPDMTPAQLQAAIQDAVRDEVTGVSTGSGGANLDRIINDAVSWAAKVYQGGERGATPAELTKWKEFAKKKLADNPDMTPSQLASAIQDAVRDDMRGVGGPASSAPLERFVKDAFKWVFELYMNQPTDKPREPTAREIRDWSNYAKEQLKKNPDLTAEDLQSVIQDGLRRALGNL
ncbi:hypothetical protein D7Y13_00685 [Corallococcus praedator]|uniref:Uncharacterized protein n=1 Tax=Corallococcus praedator TaxID=2316724 RepID=A0ABX9QTM5_9BACT|nr:MULTISPECIES: hypothetical protein [Corallococcus]RKH35895.1 hypothetical protein D7X75_02475 [Corallococcus sp. CA031C]RKI17641.1 hypothetical protein D7Y13_00685 [Corallococcus praedator]